MNAQELIAEKKAEMDRVQAELAAAQKALYEQEEKAKAEQRRKEQKAAFEKNVKTLEPIAQALVAALKAVGLKDAGYKNAVWSEERTWESNAMPSVWADKRDRHWGYQIVIEMVFSGGRYSWSRGVFVGYRIAVGDKDSRNGTRVSRYSQAKDGSFNYAKIAEKVKERREYTLNAELANAKREGMSARNQTIVGRLAKRFGELSSFDKTRYTLYWATLVPSQVNEGRVSIKDMDFDSLTEMEAEEVLALAKRIREDHKKETLRSERSGW